MSIDRRVTASGQVRYRVRVKAHGRVVASRTFERRTDAREWERDQLTHLHQGDWVDPRRGRISLALMAESWLLTRGGVKRRTRETDELMWRLYIEPVFGTRRIATITTAEISEWAGALVAGGKSAATSRRALATLRGILSHAVADERLIRNAAASAIRPRGGAVREGQVIEPVEVRKLAAACAGKYADVVTLLAYTGMRWGELAGLQVGDRIRVPGSGLRLQRAAIAGGGSGDVYIDTLKDHEARTIPLVPQAASVVDRWVQGRDADEWLFPSANGTPLSEGNWKRSVKWSAAKVAIKRPTFRVHDLRHTAASIWLASGADPKVVQRILGHASAAMTMDPYGHLIDRSLWDAAKRIGGISGASDVNDRKDRNG